MDPRPEQSVLANDVEHVEYERLLGVLRRALLQNPPELDRARELLATVDSGLPEHLRLEEVQVFPWLLDQLPSARDEVDHLLREHLQLVTALTGLRLSMRGEPEGGVIASALRFVEHFRRHAERERSLTAAALEQRAGSKS